MEKQLTAVQWLAKNLKDFPHVKHSQLFRDLVQQAKEMEKEQKKKFFKVGFSQGFASDIISYHKLDNEKEKLFEQYYKETFK
jgi:hypothetical protein